MVAVSLMKKTMATKENGDLQIHMKEYLNECISAYEEIDGKLVGEAKTPAKHDLFYVNKESQKGVRCAT